MKIFVTGATGFIGASFTRLALARGHTIAALVRDRSTAPDENVTSLRGSLADPPWEDITAFGPDACLHAAWIATPGVYLNSPSNAEYAAWTINFGRELRERGLSHFVGLGTCIEYAISSSQNRLREDETPLAPASPYARAKDATRAALTQIFADSGTAFTWARIFYPYGPGEHPARLCSSLIRQLSSGETALLQRPDNVNDYIFIDDLAEAILRIFETRFRGAINLGTGQGVTVSEIAAEIRAQLVALEGSAGAIEGVLGGPADCVVADATRLRGLGWAPCTSLAQAVGALLHSAAGERQR